MNGEETMSGNSQAQAAHEASPEAAVAETTVSSETAKHVAEGASHLADTVPQAAEALSNVAESVSHIADAAFHMADKVSHGQTVVQPPAAEPAVATSTEEPRKRPVLNPSVEDHQTRAVGSIGAEVETEAEAVAAAAAAQTEAVLNSTGPVGQIELPPKQVSLDDGLEQEIEAAMTGQMTSPTSPPVGAANINPSSNAEELPASEEQLESGTKLKAKVQSVTADDVFCEVGYRSPGVLPARQFPQGKQPRVGEEFLVIVEKYDPENSVILVN